MVDSRMHITSLLNTQDQQPRAGSTTPSTACSEFDAQTAISSRENTQTPATLDHSPSPTISERSVSSDSVIHVEQTPRRQSSSTNNSSSSSQRHRYSRIYSPYTQSQRPAHAGSSRQFRPSYGVEESIFIWYHRIDLNLDWRQVAARFNSYFEQQRSGFQGFQCKFYRYLQEHGLPSTRERAKDPNGSITYGVRTWKPDVWYEWMKAEAQTA